MTFDLVQHVAKHMDFSAKTFGPGERTKGVIAHIRKELAEIESDPTDIEEWIDVMTLAIDGAWRHGGTPESISRILGEKLEKNIGRTWPDWRTASPDKAIEHVRDEFRAYQVSDSEVWAARSPEEAVEAAMKATGLARDEYSPISECYVVPNEARLLDAEHESTIGEELARVTEPRFICGDE